MNILIGAVIAVVVGGIGTWFGVALGASKEHEAWVRNARREAYAQFVTSASKLDTEQVITRISQQALDDVVADSVRHMLPADAPPAALEQAAKKVAESIRDELDREAGASAKKAVELTHTLAEIEIFGPAEVQHAAAEWWAALAADLDTTALQAAFLRASKRVLGTN